MATETISPDERYAIRAYCTKCGRMIIESNRMSSKKLKEEWNFAIMSAPLNIECECKKTRFNFDIDFKLYDYMKEKYVKPSKLIGKTMSLDDVKSSYSLNDATSLISDDKKLTPQERMEYQMELRRKYYSQVNNTDK